MTVSNSNQTVELYSANVCPFAHRTRLVLLEKGISFDTKEIDLGNKPEWFSDISPYGKVPVIKHGENRIWESAVINEYLEEVFPTPSLLPEDPMQKALARIWIDFANTRLIPAFYKLLLNQDLKEQEKWAQELTEHLLFMEKEGIGKFGGPYWLGEQFTLVDITLYPWFERWPIIEKYRGLKLPQEAKNLKEWWQNLAQRESVKSIANPADFYIQMYTQYANGQASGSTAKEILDK